MPPEQPPMPPQQPETPDPTPQPVPPPTISYQQPNVAPQLKPHLPQRMEKISSDLLEPGEELVTVVRKHWIGLIGYYLEGVLGVVVIIGFAIFLSAVNNGFSRETSGLLIGGIILAIAIMVFFLFVTTYVYRQCKILVTDRSLVQILQKSLFIRKVSRLSLSNVEDVSAESRGILASLFGFGTLLVQTAGEMENFEFTYCPNPTLYADQIIEARQRYALSLREEEDSRPAEHLIRNQ